MNSGAGAMKQHLSSLQPLTCATGKQFSSQCDSNPICIAQESAVLSSNREGLFLTAPSSSLPWARDWSSLFILLMFPLQTPKFWPHWHQGCHCKVASSQGHPEPAMQQSEGLLRDVGALQPLKHVPQGKYCPSPVSVQGRGRDGDIDDGAAKDWGENRS